MSKTWKTILIILIMGLLGFLVYQSFTKPQPPEEPDLKAMRNSIAADPVINAPNLSEEQKNKYLLEFQKAREEVIKANFDILQGINDIALLKQYLGDLDGAITAWEYANIIRPLNSLSFSNLAALYHFDLHEYGLAEKNYLISIANDPDDIPTIRNLYELYHDALKDAAKAEALFLKSIEENPAVADLYALAGSFYQEIGNKTRAIEYYQKNLELSPGNEAVKRELQKLQAEAETAS